jgi:hypothetical protein
LSPKSATPRLVSCGTDIAAVRGRLYRHSRLPLLTSIAMTWLFGLVTNITPPLTSGAAWWTRASAVEKTHIGRRRATLAGVICVNGLNPQPSYVRRIISQFSSSGFFSRSVVTGR